MLDIAVAYNRYRFIGYEFLTWLWFAIERNPTLLQSPSGDSGSLNLGNRIVLENFTRDKTESITIKGDDPNFDAALLSLKNGALVTDRRGLTSNSFIYAFVNFFCGTAF